MNKKIIAFVLATALLAGVIAPAVGAEEEVTIESLQKVIAELVATIASLRSQLGGQTTPVATGLCLTSDLSQGMTSAEVKILQQGLNQNVATQVAAAGAGAAGAETTYFGPLTRTAVVKFQELYAAEVLTPGGLAKGTGFAGPATRAKFNALFCSPVTPPTTIPEEDEAPPAYGSLSVVSYPVSNPVTTVYGGQTYELVAGQYKATGSDMTIKKVSVKTTSDTANVFPWQAFTSISVWDGSTKLAELPVTQTNAIENTFAKVYTFDISGLNWKIAKDAKEVLTVKATVVPGVSASLSGKQFIFSLLKDGVVSSDTAKVTYTSVTGADIDSQQVTINDAKQASFTVTAAVDNPKTKTVVGSKSSTSRIELLKFNLKNNSDIAATFNSGTIEATSTMVTTSTMRIVSVELLDGDTLLAAAAPNATGTVTWSNFSLSVAGNTTKTLRVEAIISQLEEDYEGGDSVQISEGPEFSGIDGNSHIASADGSSVVGRAQMIYLSGPVVTLKSDPTFSITGTTEDPRSFGTAKIVFNILAAGNEDIYLATTTNADSNVTPSVTSPNTVTNGFTCTAGADKQINGSWRIVAGNTGVCELTTFIDITTTTAGDLYQVAAKKIYWGITENTLTNEYTGNLSEFITGQEYMSHK